MRLRLVPLALALAGLVAAPLAAQQDEPPATVQEFRVDVNLVTLRFTIQDAAGRFVNDITADELLVLENGIPRELTFFEAPPGGADGAGALWLAFLIDVSGSTFATRAEEILAARAFFENIHAFTRVGIFGFTDQVIPFHEFSPDKQAALAAFNSARTHLGKTALYESVDSVIQRMRSLAGPDEPKVLIVVSDGLDEAHARSAASARLARDNNARIFTIWVPSAAQLAVRSAGGSDAAEPTPERARLEQRRRTQEEAYSQLSTRSGGRHFGGFEAILNFDEVLAEINDEVFGNLYAMAYRTPAPELDRSQRNVEIQLRRPGVQVQGLFHKVPDRVRAKKSLIEALFDDEALASLHESVSSFREIGVQLDVLGTRREGEQVRLPFRLKISPHQLRGDRQSGAIRTQFGIIGLLIDPSGRSVARLREVFRVQRDGGDDARNSILYTNSLVAPPGQYVFRLAVVEIASWRMTVFERTLRLP